MIIAQAGAFGAVTIATNMAGRGVDIKLGGELDEATLRDVNRVRSAEATGAVDFIIEASHRYGDELVYVPTGPLTNLAAALEKDPGLAERLKVVLMGGALSVSGNVSPWAEANISQDPDAADTVFRSGVSKIGRAHV